MIRWSDGDRTRFGFFAVPKSIFKCRTGGLEMKTYTAPTIEVVYLNSCNVVNQSGVGKSTKSNAVSVRTTTLG